MLSFFPRDVLDEIWDLFESVSEGLLTYSLLNLNIVERVIKLSIHLLIRLLGKTIIWAKLGCRSFDDSD